MRTINWDGLAGLLDVREPDGHNDAVMPRPFRKTLSLALLLALCLPAMVTAAIAVHEATHHPHGAASSDNLAAVVHGHHHGQEIEEHAHEAVVTKTRAGSTAEWFATPSTHSDRCVEGSLGTVRSEGDGPLPEPPRSPDLCVWRL